MRTTFSRPRWWALGVVAALVVVTALVLGLAQARGAEGDTGAIVTQQADLTLIDHFKCYLSFGLVNPQTVTLEDQFGRADAVVTQPLRFCNPVEKLRFETGQFTPIRHPFAHLKCYRIDSLGAFTPRDVDVTNQFGAERFKVVQPDSLCVPTQKLFVDGIEEPIGPPPESELDHFKCYRVASSPRFLTVGLRDQFDFPGGPPTAFPVLQATELCNPVEKVHNGQVFPRKFPDVHLTCYFVQDVTPRFHDVEARNQFGGETLRTLEAERLCVPSTKEVVPPPPPPTPELSHFKCYNAKAKFTGATVFLSDQFAQNEAELKKPELFCNPVEKTFGGEVTPITNREAHLKCYSLKEEPQFHGADVEVRNQFGVQRLSVRKARALCAPASKSETDVPPGEPPSNISHFKCYDVRPVKTPKRAVVLRDQFHAEDAVVDGPRALCTPVEKRTATGEVFPIVTPPSGVNHLVCYDIIKTNKLTARTVLARTQFGLEEVRVDGARLLCLPSTKRVL